MRTRWEILLVVVVVLVGAVLLLRGRRTHLPAGMQGPLEAAPPVTDEITGWRKVHVFVALCDNVHQGIVPVPAAIGNGQDPARNLYWGAANGVRTYFSRSANWKRLATIANPKPHVLERLIFRHARKKVYLVADAYDGAYIQQAIHDAITASSGAAAEAVTIEQHHFAFAGGADVIAFVGHNGLMDAPLTGTIIRNHGTPKQVILLCCASDGYFAPLLRAANAVPLLWTTQLMCPEAYTLETALHRWTLGDTPVQIHAQAAASYSRYQHCSVKAAKKLLKTGW